MVKIRKNIENKEFLEFIGVANANILENFDTKILRDKIIQFNEFGERKINYLYCYLDFTEGGDQTFGDQVFLEALSENINYYYEYFCNNGSYDEGPIVEGVDFMSLQYSNDFDHLNVHEVEEKCLKYFEDKNLDFILFNPSDKALGVSWVYLGGVCFVVFYLNRKISVFFKLNIQKEGLKNGYWVFKEKYGLSITR